MNSDTDEVVFSQPRLSQAISDKELVTKVKSLAKKPSDERAKCPMRMPTLTSQKIQSRAWSHSCVVPRSGLEDADMVALHIHIQEVHAGSKDLLSRCGGRKN